MHLVRSAVKLVLILALISGVIPRLAVAQQTASVNPQQSNPDPPLIFVLGAPRLSGAGKGYTIDPAPKLSENAEVHNPSPSWTSTGNGNTLTCSYSLKGEDALVLDITGKLETTGIDRSELYDGGVSAYGSGTGQSLILDDLRIVLPDDRDVKITVTVDLTLNIQAEAHSTNDAQGKPQQSHGSISAHFLCLSLDDEIFYDPSSTDPTLNQKSYTYTSHCKGEITGIVSSKYDHHPRSEGSFQIIGPNGASVSEANRMKFPYCISLRDFMQYCDLGKSVPITLPNPMPKNSHAVIPKTAFWTNEIIGFGHALHQGDIDFKGSATGRIEIKVEPEDGRYLTEGEIAIAKEVFKDSINNYSDILIHHRKFIGDINIFQGDNTAVTRPNNIYYPQDDPLYSNDFSLDAPNKKRKFIHEMTHIYQYDIGRDVAARVILHSDDRVYEYTLDNKKNFDDFGIEQQASLVGDYFGIALCQPPLSPLHALGKYSVDMYIRILPFNSNKNIP